MWHNSDRLRAPWPRFMLFTQHETELSQDFVSEEDSVIHPTQDVEFNAGIAVALPVSVITDLLN